MLIEDTESDKLRQILSVSLHMYLRLKKSFKVESLDRNVFKIPSRSAVYIVSSPLSNENYGGPFTQCTDNNFSA